MNDQNQVAMITFDAAAFRSWLVAHAGEVVGFTANEMDCPVARFLREMSGIPYIVDAHRCYPAHLCYEGMPLCDGIPLPEWMSMFINSLDFTYTGDAVTGEQALAFLSDPLINAEYCWMHTPGGWTCAQCRQPGQLQLATREGLYV